MRVGSPVPGEKKYGRRREEEGRQLNGPCRVAGPNASHVRKAQRSAWGGFLFTIISVVGIAPQLGVAVMCGVVGNLLALPAFLA